MHTYWTSEFGDIVRSRLIDPVLEKDFHPEFDLKAGGLDSLETIGLLVELEQKLHITFPDDALDQSTFATPGALWSVVVRCLAQEQT